MMKTLGRVFAIAMCFVRIIAQAMAQTVAASSGTSQAIPREINTLDAARPVTAADIARQPIAMPHLMGIDAATYSYKKVRAAATRAPLRPR
jgi:hypothetical protein